MLAADRRAIDEALPDPVDHLAGRHIVLQMSLDQQPGAAFLREARQPGVLADDQVATHIAREHAGAAAGFEQLEDDEQVLRSAAHEMLPAATHQVAELRRATEIIGIRADDRYLHFRFVEVQVELRDSPATLALRRGDRILDVCCGSGASALAAARRIGPEGSVIAQVAQLWRMVRPGGKLAITTWGPDLFAPPTRSGNEPSVGGVPTFTRRSIRGTGSQRPTPFVTCSPRQVSVEAEVD